MIDRRRARFCGLRVSRLDCSVISLLSIKDDERDDRACLGDAVRVRDLKPADAGDQKTGFQESQNTVGRRRLGFRSFVAYPATA